MRSFHRISLICALGFASGAVAMACGSSTASNFGGPDGGGDGTSTTGPNADGGGITMFRKDAGSLMGPGTPGTDAGMLGADAFFATDPPAMYCGVDGGMPPTPGGTVECPSDKNREGCPCPKIGTTAACWPGLRADRDLGVCKDGTTTCVSAEEGLAMEWGACMGYVLPTPGATSGAAACKCFSGGQWAIANLSPCFVSSGSGTTGPFYGVSTFEVDGGASCPTNITAVPVPLPTQPWSTDTLTVDCEGHYNLCYTLKAGSATSPQPTDCTVASVCTQGYYTTPNMPQVFPPLPAWTTMDSTCATQFNNTGGYGVMTVQGLSELCEGIGANDGGAPEVFNTVQYCPSSCNSDPTGPGCTNCMQGGGGSFGN